MKRIQWMVAAAAVVYPVWVVVTRLPVARPRIAQTISAPEGRGDGGPVITQFYAPSGQLTRGDHSVICYGVSNAVSVALEPPIEKLKPAMNRCFEIAPEKTTRFTLTAVSSDGRRRSESFVVKVVPAPPWIEFFAYGPKEILRGEAFAMCYRIKNAVSAELQPIRMNLPPVGKRCIQAHPTATLHYTLAAFGEDGQADRVKFDVRVK